MTISGIRKLERPTLRRSMMLPGFPLPPEKKGGRSLQPIALVETLKGGRSLIFHGVSKRGHKHQTEAHQRSHLAEIQLAWKKAKRAGLPVPSFSVVDRRKFSGGTMKNQNYLHVIREDMRKRFGPLHSAQRDHAQITLKGLSTQNEHHVGLVKEMANDLATMYSNGVYSKTGTIWHLYHLTNEKYGRVIVNVDSLGLLKKGDNVMAKSMFNKNIDVLSHQLKPAMLSVFMREIMKTQWWKEVYSQPK